jgi:tRNA(fMet)-specific endonuclease VapC
VDYLLDTNACIALINGKPASVRSRFSKAQHANRTIFVSSIVAFELWYGVAKSSLREFNTQRVEAFFRGPVTLLTFEEEDARMAGSIRAALEISGKPIGAYDLLIAGQAMRHQLTLVTANISEFKRVKGLSWQDWAEA